MNKNYIKIKISRRYFDTINYIEEKQIIEIFIFSNLHFIWTNKLTRKKFKLWYNRRFLEWEFESKIKGTTKSIFLKYKNGNQRF